MVELERFFRTLLEQMTIPAVLSTHFLLGYMIPLDVLERLVDDYPHIIGINVSTNDLGYLTRVIQLVDGRADVHVGGPMHALSGLALGAQGFFSTEGAIAPKLCASVINNFAAGDQAATFAAFQRLMHLSAINVWPGGSVRYIKSALRVLGQPGWYTRPPYLPLDESLDDHILPAHQGARNPGVRGPGTGGLGLIAVPGRCDVGPARRVGVAGGLSPPTTRPVPVRLCSRG